MADQWLVKATTLKEVVLSKLDSTPETQRDRAPAPDAWSQSGVVEHLILFEENIAGPWRQKLLDKPSARVGFKSRLASGMVNFIVSKTGARVPTLTELEPKGGLSIDELKTRWAMARKQLVASLPGDAQSPWIIHPALGPLSSGQMGRLIASHLEHHLRHWPE